MEVEIGNSSIDGEWGAQGPILQRDGDGEGFLAPAPWLFFNKTHSIKLNFFLKKVKLIL